MVGTTTLLWWKQPTDYGVNNHLFIKLVFLTFCAYLSEVGGWFEALVLLSLAERDPWNRRNPRRNGLVSWVRVHRFHYNYSPTILNSTIARFRCSLFAKRSWSTKRHHDRESFDSIGDPFDDDPIDIPNTKSSTVRSLIRM